MFFYNTSFNIFQDVDFEFGTTHIPRIPFKDGDPPVGGDGNLKARRGSLGFLGDARRWGREGAGVERESAGRAAALLRGPRGLRGLSRCSVHSRWHHRVRLCMCRTLNQERMREGSRENADSPRKHAPCARSLPGPQFVVARNGLLTLADLAEKETSPL